MGHDWLPVIIAGGNYAMAVSKGVAPAVWVLTLVAMLSLWQRPQRLVDLWLMLVMWVWLFDIGLSAVIGSSRFDLGFYAGRIFGLIASSFLLVALLVELAQLYTSALGAAADAERRLAELARSRARTDVPLGREAPERFIVRQNIARYRARLESGRLSEAERSAIEKLLAEEEAKLQAKP